MIRQAAVFLMLVSSLGAAACAPAAAPPAAPAADAPADIEALHAARQAFIAAYQSGDAAAIGRLYTADAVSEPNNQPSLKGRDAIVDNLKRMFETVSAKPELIPEETRTQGNIGLDRGRYVMTATPKAGGPPTSTEGRYLVLFVKEDDGVWRVSRDIDNTVNAAPPPGARAGTAKPKGAKPGSKPRTAKKSGTTKPRPAK